MAEFATLSGMNWLFLAVEGDAHSNEFRVLDFTDNEATAEGYLSDYPEANIYALVKTKEVRTRTIA